LREDDHTVHIDYARAEIEQRNLIRREAQLPPVSVARELRRLYQLQRRTDFEQFFQTSPIRQRVEQKLLHQMRRLRDDPQWKDEEADGTHLANATTIVGRDHCLDIRASCLIAPLKRLTQVARLRFKRLHEKNALYFREFLDPYDGRSTSAA
jgi:hypothetical protein